MEFNWTLFTQYLILGVTNGALIALIALGYTLVYGCLLYTSDAADERSSVDLGGRRIIKKKNNKYTGRMGSIQGIVVEAGKERNM